jgi:hypothetical protein
VNLQTVTGTLAGIFIQPRDHNYGLRLRDQPKLYTVGGRTLVPNVPGMSRVATLTDLVAFLGTVSGDVVVELHVDLERPDYAIEANLVESPALTPTGVTS